MTRELFSENLRSRIHDDEWLICQDKYDPKENLKYESLFALSNGYLGIRGLILSLFDYGDVVYGTSINARFSRKIQILQNSCLRFSFNIPFRDHITPHLKNLSILSMTNRRQFHLMTFIYRILTTEQPPYLFSLFHYVDHDHSTRQVHYFKIPQHRTANFQKSFSFIAPHLWNNISNNFKFQSFTDYKKQIKNHLLNS